MTGAPQLREVADGVFAYLQPGGWGFSNAGLVSSAGASLLVDTLYDLPLTERMLGEMRRVAKAPIESVVNTHANGDHCWGNQLVGNAKIVSSRAAAEEMLELSPQVMHNLVRAARAIEKLGPLAAGPLRLLGRLGIKRAEALRQAAPFIVEAFGAFDFGGISLRKPDTVFDGQLVLRVGDKEVHLFEVGPAHTQGDVLVYVPQDRVVFTGDILFIGSHPIAWEGPIQNSINACDRILALDVDVVIPGHGPLTDKAGVLETRRYWERLQTAAAEVGSAGLPEAEALCALNAHKVLGEQERLVVNMDTALRELSGVHTPRDPLVMLARMGRFAEELRALRDSSFPRA